MAKFKTPVFRVAFPHVFEAKQRNNQGKAKFSVAMLFDPVAIKQDPQQQKLLDAMKQAVTDACMEKWNKIPGKFKKPFKKGDEQISGKTDEVYDGFTGMVVVYSNSDTKPGLVDQGMNAIIEPGEFYGGVYAQATVSVFAWDHPTGGKGVSFGLQNIQKVRDGDSFGGGKSDPNEDFEAIEVAITSEGVDESLFD